MPDVSYVKLSHPEIYALYHGLSLGCVLNIPAKPLEGWVWALTYT